MQTSSTIGEFPVTADGRGPFSAEAWPHGQRVKVVPRGEFGVVKGTDIFGGMLAIRIDSDRPGQGYSYCHPADVRVAGLRLLAPGA